MKLLGNTAIFANTTNKFTVILTKKFYVSKAEIWKFAMLSVFCPYSLDIIVISLLISLEQPTIKKV